MANKEKVYLAVAYDSNHEFVGLTPTFKAVSADEARQLVIGWVKEVEGMEAGMRSVLLTEVVMSASLKTDLEVN